MALRLLLSRGVQMARWITVSVGVLVPALAVAESRIASATPAHVATPAFPSPSRSPSRSPLRLSVVAGIGIRRAWRPYDTDDAAAAHATVGYRVLPKLAFGVHVTASSTSGKAERGAGNVTPGYSIQWRIDAVDVAIAAQYRLHAFTFSPWLGRRLSHLVQSTDVDSTGPLEPSSHLYETRWKNDATMYGVTLTVGAPRRVPLTLFVDLATNVGSVDLSYWQQGEWSSATIGLAYWQ